MNLGNARQYLSRTRTLAVLACCLLVASLSVSAQSLETRRLSDNMLFIKGPDSNVLAVKSSEGLILVDGGHADWYDGLRQVLDANFPSTPIRALINTHWHPDQTGANVPLGREGVEIIAHENTQQWLSTKIWQRWSGETFAPLPAAGLPTTTFYDDTDMQIGDQHIYFGHAWNAHTDGDIWVYFEDGNVLVTGGMVSNGRWPEIDWWTGGYIGGLLDGFVSLLTVPDANTTIIPAYGDVMTLEELQAQNQMYLTVFDRFHGSLIDSYSLADILAEHHTAEFDAQMGDPTQFMTLAFESFQGRVRDPQNYRVLNIP